MYKEENKTPQPQPITLAEFVSGVEFYHSPKFKPFDDIDTYHRTRGGYIVDKYGNLYCSIQYIDNEGFSCIHYIFGHPNEFKVLFKNCFKLPNQ